MSNGAPGRGRLGFRSGSITKGDARQARWISGFRHLSSAMTPLARDNAPSSGAGPAFPQRSFWSEDYGAYVPGPPLRGSIKVDVAIIGAGFTGLSAAINLRQLDGAAKVAVFEQEAVGFGASGRNSGWVWPNFSGYEAILAGKGVEALRECYAYAKRAYAYVGDLVATHGLESEYRVTGLLRPSVSPEYERDRAAYTELCHKMGREAAISEVNEAQLAHDYASPLFHKALWDKDLALIHPVKHARALAQLASALGTNIYEQTPIIEIEEGAGGVRLAAPGASVLADRVVIATNAYTHLLNIRGTGVAKYQRPAFLYNVVSRPLKADEWAALKWKQRNAIYTFGPGSHFGNPTADGRVHWCSDRFVTVPDGRDMSPEYVANYIPTLRRQTDLFFPAMKGVALTHHWGGAVSVTPDQVFHLGYLNDKRRILISLGCNGNGVSLTHLNGRVLAELLTDRRSDLCDVWFVNRKGAQWPDATLSAMMMRGVLAYDRWRARERARQAGLAALVEDAPLEPAP